MIGIASVLLVITPISWILLHQPQNDDADASVPMVTRTDDTYITPSTKPVVVPPSALASTPPTTKPTVTPTPTPTASPTDSPTDSATPSPTDRPTQTPTEGTTTAPTQAPTSPGRTVTTTNPTPTKTTTTAPPPPPPVDGGMDSNEMQLFNLIDNARVNNGCARLKQDPNLTNAARSTATDRATTGKSLNKSSSSLTGAGGDSMSAQQAFDQMMSNNRSTVLNCGLTTLGVGRNDVDYQSGLTCPILFCSTRNRVAWVADFS